MADLEERLAEAVMKKKEIEKKVSEMKGTTISAIEQAIKARLGDIVKKVDAKVVGRELIVVIYPNEKYRDCLEILEPMKYSTVLTRKEYEDLMKERPGIVRKITEIIVDKFMMGYFKPQLLTTFGVEITARKVGRARALEMFAWMCQQGSIFHCTALYNAISHLIGEAVSEEDRSLKSYFIDYIRKAGFPLTAEFIDKLNPMEYSFEELDMIEDAIKQGVKEAISRYGRIVYDASALSSEEISKVKRVVNEACKKMDFELKPKPFDESIVMEVLKRAGVEVSTPSAPSTSAPSTSAQSTEETQPSAPMQGELSEMRKKLINKLKRYE